MGEVILVSASGRVIATLVVVRSCENLAIIASSVATDAYTFARQNRTVSEGDVAMNPG